MAPWWLRAPAPREAGRVCGPRRRLSSRFERRVLWSTLNSFRAVRVGKAGKWRRSSRAVRHLRRRPASSPLPRPWSMPARERARWWMSAAQSTRIACRHAAWRATRAPAGGGARRTPVAPPSQLYAVPPTGTLSIEEFETFAIQRLRGEHRTSRTLRAAAAASEPGPRGVRHVRARAQSCKRLTTRTYATATTTHMRAGSQRR